MSIDQSAEPEWVQPVPPVRRRLPIYGERDIDAALRGAYEDWGYGEWLMERLDEAPVLVVDLDCEMDVIGATVLEVDAVVRHWIAEVDGSGDIDDRAEQVADEHDQQREAWLQFTVEGKIGRAIGAQELDHFVCCPHGMDDVEPPEHGGVYAIEGVPGWVKIGKAKNIAKRMRDLQVGSPVPLRLLAVLSDDASTEGAFHARWRHLRASGEWFKAEPDLKAALVAARLTWMRGGPLA